MRMVACILYNQTVEGRKEPHVLRGYNDGAIERMNELQGFIKGRRTRDYVKSMLK